MKVLVELNLTNPAHQQIFDQLRGPVPPPEYTNAVSSPPPSQTVPAGVQQQPSFAPPGLSPPAGPPIQAPMQTLESPPTQPQTPPATIMQGSPPMNPVAPVTVPPAATLPPSTPVNEQQPAAPQIDATRPLRDQLSDAFSAAFAKNPKAAEELSTKLRAEIDVDMNKWTDQQVQTAISQVQAIATF